MFYYILILLAITIATVALIDGIHIFNLKKTSSGKGDSNLTQKLESTRNLIGDEKYQRMSKNVDEILHRHRNDMCQSLNLTSGAVSKESSLELHGLLPGDPLQLRIRSNENISGIDVYSNGYRVGSLLLDDAEKGERLIRDNCVKGVYVSEQNCYDDPSTLSLKMIVFYTPKTERKILKEKINQSIKVILDNSRSLNFCEN